MAPSFAYLYDGVLQEAGWAKAVARIEGEAGRLGIQGPVLRDGFHEIEAKIKELRQEGMKNLVFVGGDAWFLHWIPWIAKQAGLGIGYLSIEASLLGKALGVPAGAAGIGVLAARVLRSLDLGTANGRPFLTEAVALKTAAKLELEGSYAVCARVPSPLSVQNLALEAKTGRVLSVPGDGKLEAVIQTTVARPAWLGLWKRSEVEETRIVFTRATVREDQDQAGIQFVVDGQLLKAREVVFDVLPAAVALIVGPERLF